MAGYIIGSADHTVTNGPLSETAADLALALRLLDAFMVNDDGVCARYGARICCEAHEMWDLDPDGPCPGAQAHEMLVRHGIREA